MAKKGETTPPSVREKMSQARIGWSPSEETRERMSEARKHRNAEETIPARQCDECAVWYQPGSWSSKFCPAHTQSGKHAILRAIRDTAEECAICGATGTKFVVDHCHGCGVIRGVLCVPCNTGIGSFRDSIDLLQRAALYLELSELILDPTIHPFHKNSHECVHQQPDPVTPLFYYVH